MVHKRCYHASLKVKKTAKTTYITSKYKATISTSWIQLILWDIKEIWLHGKQNRAIPLEIEKFILTLITRSNSPFHQCLSSINTWKYKLKIKILIEIILQMTWVRLTWIFKTLVYNSKIRNQCQIKQWKKRICTNKLKMCIPLN